MERNAGGAGVERLVIFWRDGCGSSSDGARAVLQNEQSSASGALRSPSRLSDGLSPITGSHRLQPRAWQRHAPCATCSVHTSHAATARAQSDAGVSARCSTRRWPSS